MTKRKPTCSHGTEHWTPSGHCRVCDQDYRERVRASKEAAFERGRDEIQRLKQHRAKMALNREGIIEADKFGAESRRVNRITELIDAHWRAGTPWERAALDAEIRRLSMQG